MADEQLRQIKNGKNEIPQKEKKTVDNKVDKKAEVKKDEQKIDNKETKAEAKKNEIPKVRKFEAIVNARSLPVSLKHSVAIGKFIKGKKIDDAISDLEQVSKKKKAIPFTGEMAHKKGPMATGKYPVKASKNFIKLLKSLSSNSTNNGMNLDKTIIYDIIPNKAPEQVHRFGRTKFKRTHVYISAKEISK